MIFGGIIAFFFGIDAEGKSLEEIEWFHDINYLFFIIILQNLNNIFINWNILFKLILDY